MVALARQTLVYEWRRFLPATMAVAFSGLMVLMQASLVLGIFSTASIYVSRSRGDLWVGYPGTQSVDLGRPIPLGTEMHLRMDPEVIRVERFRWVDGDWRGPVDRGGVSVFVTGIDARADGLVFADSIDPSQRTLLREPGAVLVDAADLPKLGVAVGAHAEVNGHRVHIVGSASHLRALGGVNIVGSLETARGIDPAAGDAATYLVLQLAHPERSAETKQRLVSDTAVARYEIWTQRELADRSTMYWLFDTGAGLGFLFGAIIVFFVGAIITSQTLMSAVAGSWREYATLRALGIGFGSLRRIVLVQSFWIGGAGLVGASLLSGLIVALARWQSVPVVLSIPIVVGSAALVMAISLLSGLTAVRSLRHADPATLLR